LNYATDLLNALTSPILLRGDATTAYRDPAAVYHNGLWHLFFTQMQTMPDGRVYSFLGTSRSRDLRRWSAPKTLTPADRGLNFGSPGSLVRFDRQWVLCLQTYPRPNGEKYGNGDARLWLMRSRDLEMWGEPELLRVKGPDVPREQMGRMIDPYLFEDKDEPGKWWCFFKQDGVSMAYSHDLTTWTYTGRAEAGENVCVLVAGEDYVMLHSPDNGIGLKRSSDLRTWRDDSTQTLGQAEWPWAQGRLTAGFVLDLRHAPEIGKYVLFFHGSGPEDERTLFDTFASIGIAWSDDLHEWDWPGKGKLGERRKEQGCEPGLQPWL
jgi:hypothetical protein